MLDIAYIRTHVDEVKKNCRDRRVKVDIDALLSLDEERRKLQHELDELRADRRQTSKAKPGPAEMERMKQVGERVRKIEKELAKIEKNYFELLLLVPNLTHPDVPIGGEDNFKVIAEEGSGLEFNFKPTDHETLMTNLDLIDFERGAKVAGAKFYYVKGDLVRLNQALIQYGIDVVTRDGYKLIETPDMVKQEILDASGFNPRGAESQVYDIAGHDLHLVGTAEISILGYHAKEVLDLSHGPIKYAGLSHCYRTEAGAYGKAMRGLFRVHQFTKLEMFIFCKPDESEKLHQELLAIEKEICDSLELQYRVISIASGDLGAPAYRKFDLEARLIMKEWGEITSTSNCTDYQARRLNIKHRRADGKTELVHTLNGTAMVLSRFPLALFEQRQQANGSVLIPKTLWPYLGGQERIGA